MLAAITNSDESWSRRNSEYGLPVLPLVRVADIVVPEYAKLYILKLRLAGSADGFDIPKCIEFLLKNLVKPLLVAAMINLVSKLASKSRIVLDAESGFTNGYKRSTPVS